MLAGLLCVALLCKYQKERKTADARKPAFGFSFNFQLAFLAHVRSTLL